MARHTIEVTVNEDGSIETEVKGLKGKACEKVVAWIKKLGRVVIDKPTREMYERESNQEKIRTGR